MCIYNRSSKSKFSRKVSGKERAGPKMCGDLFFAPRWGAMPARFLPDRGIDSS